MDLLDVLAMQRISLSQMEQEDARVTQQTSLFLMEVLDVLVMLPQTMCQMEMEDVNAMALLISLITQERVLARLQNGLLMVQMLVNVMQLSIGSLMDLLDVFAMEQLTSLMSLALAFVTMQLDTTLMDQEDAHSLHAKKLEIKTRMNAGPQLT